jgi:hypothetical protein
MHVIVSIGLGDPAPGHQQQTGRRLKISSAMAAAIPSS